ncbi:hypothetical protein M0654_09330 [Rhizobium sp. NTR19]|uniref:SGNH hydrolase-type esterase domain-containing protein n=1 Tax=Neorhizobium turbinariae TaxID=2937795 RepID=A0ABT0IQN3_9HYPH|nr:hypothetical protein [Neorhizobium turbinariae]MCK8780185.1 hypothetical protein [Neorhizobium turbinariae]
MRLHVCGDSHSAYCFDRFENAVIKWLGPLTMHRAARDAEQIIRPLLSDVEADDIVVFILGEIDIRCHLIPVAERSGSSVDDEAAKLAHRYVLAISQLIGPSNAAVIVQPPYPADRRSNPELPFIGSLQHRIDTHQALSKHLMLAADAAGLHYLPFPRKYADARGGLRRKFSDDGVHIMPVEAAALAKSLSSLLDMKIKFHHSPLDIIRRRWNYLFGGSLRRRGLPKAKPMVPTTR